MISLTDAAKEKFLDFLSTKECLGIRISVVQYGCSGYSYQLEECNEILNTDWIYWVDGIRFAVRGEFRDKLEGLRINWVEGDLGGFWEYKSPLETGRCGCGKSFSVV